MGKESVAAALGYADPKPGQEDEQDAPEALSKLCEDYLKLDAQVTAINERLKDAKEQRDRCELIILNKLLEGGMKSIKTRMGYRFTSVEKSYYSLPPQADPDKREEAVKWLKRVGARELFKEQISDATLTSFLRERVEDGKAVNELIGSYKKTALSVVKDKASKA